MIKKTVVDEKFIFLKLLSCSVMEEKYLSKENIIFYC